MGTIKTTNIEPIADNGTVTLGSSGDTFTLGSGVVQSNLNYPAFRAEKSSTQAIPNGTFTKITFETEIFDTNSAYDTSNSRFTIPSGMGGKYFVGANILIRNAGDINTVDYAIYINGTQDDTYRRVHDYISGTSQYQNSTFGFVLELSASDYIEIYNYQNSGGNMDTSAYSTNLGTFWFAYRIGS